MKALPHEPPVAEVQREGLVERRRVAAPGQKLILVGTSTVAALLILFGIASRHQYFGLFGGVQGPKVSMAEDTRPLAAPDVRVPLNLGEAPAAPDYVDCPGGLRLPIGLNCPEPAKAEAAAPAASAGPSEADLVRERRRRSGLGLGGGVQAMAVGARDAVAAVSGPAGSASNGLASALVGTAVPAASAAIIRNPSMTLARGTLPDCTLLTAILTEQPGFLKCLLSGPVMSMDGKVVLMEAGTTLEGEYTQGLQAGQRAIFTLWTRAVTPHFVTVQLNSPGTDALGRAGTSGHVDNRWFDRFAGAILFSILQDAKDVYLARENDRAAARASAQGAGDTFNIGLAGDARMGNTSSTARSVVEEMLTQGRALRPVLYKNQGEVIKVFVARDVDFSAVYELRPAAPAPLPPTAAGPEAPTGPGEALGY